MFRIPTPRYPPGLSLQLVWERVAMVIQSSASNGFLGRHISFQWADKQD